MLGLSEDESSIHSELVVYFILKIYSSWLALRIYCKYLRRLHGNRCFLGVFGVTDLKTQM